MDKEIEAMTTVTGALSALDEDARVRVLTWAAQRFAPEMEVASGTPDAGVSREPDRTFSAGGDYAHFADLYDEVSPTTNGERLLVGGYWKQVIEGAESFSAQQVNNLLKDVGHGVESIAKVFTSLQQRSPALVRQLSKSGRTQQARKTYKLTTAGINEIRGRL